ncbi:MAG: nucleotidyltransferase family protein [Actinomycetes bacterium]
MNGRFPLIAAAESHGASNLRVFGSVARGEDGPDSDVDLQRSHLTRAATWTTAWATTLYALASSRAVKR